MDSIVLLLFLFDMIDAVLIATLIIPVTFPCILEMWRKYNFLFISNWYNFLNIWKKLKI